MAMTWALLLISPMSIGETLSNTTLTVKMAISRALEISPRLQASSATVSAAQAEQTQSALRPNPELLIEAENFAGSGDYQHFDQIQMTYQLSQLVEMGDKRQHRINAAQKMVELNQYAYTAERLDLIRDVRIAYANAVGADEQLLLKAEQKKLAAELFEEVTQLVNAAREPLLQKSKAEISVATTTFAYQKAQREKLHSLHLLSSFWNAHEDNFALDNREYFLLTPPLTEDQVEAQLLHNPTLQQAQANQVWHQALYELEKSQARQDPRISVGIRDLQGENEQALVAGIALPLPLFNRNQGNIKRTQQQLLSAESQHQSQIIELRNQLFEAHENMINAYHQAHSLKNTILPAANKTFTLARQGYRAGKFSYLEVLDAQRTLFDTKQQYIDALNEYHHAYAQVERLTGGAVSGIKIKEQSNAS
jgi:cobalt-zinc-cadmium efflux system outer membrane protein